MELRAMKEKPLLVTNYKDQTCDLNKKVAMVKRRTLRKQTIWCCDSNLSFWLDWLSIYLL
uniref:Uncharacterized protein n=1 Tax=Physcomitrium patens TaxID=3218 RepID=A0A2K1K067_PHYPA|nr:hypothetical protein PHYPA_014289 [Physcomitrium patens]